ncbi:MAG: hypothetical protein GF398_12205 [Chitinivibrionales bacterium]|nr:hypothetical protein [Chitinivibrionales bacterium]
MPVSVTAICGSRNRNGKTAAALQQFLGGCRSAGAEATEYYLPEQAIERCRQCDPDGWGDCRDKGACIIDDDFDAIVQSIRSAQGVVFATPVYWGDLSESIRAFTDRLRRICAYAGNADTIEGKPAVGICVAGGSGGGWLTCCVSLEKTVTQTGFILQDIFALNKRNLPYKNKALAAAGTWLVSHA